MRMIILLLVLSFGCRPQPQPQPVENTPFVLTNSLSQVREEFLKLPQEDQDFIYKQFAGSAEFLKRSNTIRSSMDYASLLGKVQSDFGWNVEKYPNFTTAVSNYLIEQGFENPRQLNSASDKQWLINIFENLTNAVK